MTNTLKRILLGFFLLVLFAAGVYYYGGWQDEKELTKAVLKYNEVLAEVYQRNDSQILSPYATPREVNRVMMHLLFFEKEKITADMESEDIEFTSALIDLEKGVVKTKEKWVYREFNLESGETILPKQEFRYHATYHLLRDKGRWKVDQVEAKKIDGEKEKNKGN